MYHIELSQLICIANQLAGFCMIRVFAERCFQTDYNSDINFNIMQWWEYNNFNLGRIIPLWTLSIVSSAALIMYVPSFPVLNSWKWCNSITDSSNRIFQFAEFNKMDRVMSAKGNSCLLIYLPHMHTHIQTNTYTQCK